MQLSCWLRTRSNKVANVDNLFFLQKKDSCIGLFGIVEELILCFWWLLGLADLGFVVSQVHWLGQVSCLTKCKISFFCPPEWFLSVNRLVLHSGPGKLFVCLHYACRGDVPASPARQAGNLSVPKR